jgi:hypothetical protein
MERGGCLAAYRLDSGVQPELNPKCCKKDLQSVQSALFSCHSNGWISAKPLQRPI